MNLPIPRALQKRLRPLQERGEEFLRNWEWTWTTAFVAGLIISFIAMTVLVVIPSWWLFFSDETLRWRSRLQITIRDMLVMGWLTVWGGVFVITAYKVQVIRRRLRGERQAERYSGGYR